MLNRAMRPSPAMLLEKKVVGELILLTLDMCGAEESEIPPLDIAARYGGSEWPGGDSRNNGAFGRGGYNTILR